MDNLKVEISDITDSIQRKWTSVLIFALDKSGCMAGKSIENVNIHVINGSNENLVYQ